MTGMSNVSKLAGEPSGQEFLVFTLGNEEYGIDILKVQEIRGYDQVTRIAKFAVTLSTEYLTGLGALGERMLILVNIEKLLNSEEMALLDIAASHVA
ncbi:hypothetical protein FO157_13660 [Salmonella enterica]|nr:hypothetical protein [Salmonella enterica]